MSYRILSKRELNIGEHNQRTIREIKDVKSRIEIDEGKSWNFHWLS